MKHLTILVLVLALVAAACSGQGAGTRVASTTEPVEPVTTLPAPPTTTTTAAPTPTTTQPPPQPPTLETAMQVGDTVETYLQPFSGTTDPDATVTVNGEPVDVASDGSFTANAWLNDIGPNTVEVTATGTSGLSVTERIDYTFVPGPGWVEAIGDSVMLGSTVEIEKRLGSDIVDATVSRQFLQAPELVAEFVAREIPPELIIIGLGTNGPVQSQHFDEVMEIAADIPLVLFVNVSVPRSWEETSNRELAEGVARYDNASLVDWFAATEGQSTLFAADGFHPKQVGRVIMAELIASAAFPGWTPFEDS